MKLALLGNPVKHSLSPLLHSSLAERCSVKLAYESITVNENELSDATERLKNEGYYGFNCTMPLKKEAARLADFSSDRETVNTVKIAGGRTFAKSTDGEGFIRAAKSKGISFDSADIVIIGNGGASRAVQKALKKFTSADIKVFNRTPDKENNIFPLYGDIFEKAVIRADVLINATPLGMDGKEEFPFTDLIGMMKKSASVCDMVYGNSTTLLAEKAIEYGLKVSCGVDMLLWQGVLSFEFWTGIIPDSRTINEVENILKQARNQPQRKE